MFGLKVRSGKAAALSVEKDYAQNYPIALSLAITLVAITNTSVAKAENLMCTIVAADPSERLETGFGR